MTRRAFGHVPSNCPAWCAPVRSRTHTDTSCRTAQLIFRLVPPVPACLEGELRHEDMCAGHLSPFCAAADRSGRCRGWACTPGCQHAGRPVQPPLRALLPRSQAVGQSSQAGVSTAQGLTVLTEMGSLHMLLLGLLGEPSTLPQVGAVPGCLLHSSLCRRAVGCSLLLLVLLLLGGYGWGLQTPACWRTVPAAGGGGRAAAAPLSS